MSIDTPDRDEELTSLLEYIQKTQSGLDGDAKNLFAGAVAALYNVKLSGDFSGLASLETYEAYITRTYPKHAVRAIIEGSNQANVQRVNILVAEYNA